MEPRNVAIKVTARYKRDGSVIQGDASVSCEGVTTELTLDCDDTTERIDQLIRMAESLAGDLGMHTPRQVPSAA